MHVIDVLLDSFTRLFRHQRYSPSGNKEHIEKIATAVAIAHNLVRIGRKGGNYQFDSTSAISKSKNLGAVSSPSPYASLALYERLGVAPVPSLPIEVWSP
jgi:hypothetical protein